ncbi:hypothetical protein ACHAWF_011303, partial [Thalassiosira exigua]
ETQRERVEIGRGRKTDLIDRLMGQEETRTSNDDPNPMDQSEAYLNNLTNAALKKRLGRRQLAVGGKKSELINRLMGRGTRRVKEWKKSDARRLLIKLLRDKRSWIHGMTDEEIYQSDPMFQNYPLRNFKEYLQNAKGAAENLSNIIEVNEREIRQDIVTFPRGQLTCQGYPYWDAHPASNLLRQDILSGNNFDPKQLWESRTEYMEFPLDVFRGHIYQEKRRQREKPGWVARRNKKAQKAHEREVNEMFDDWNIKQQGHQEDELNKLCQSSSIKKLNSKKSNLGLDDGSRRAGSGFLDYRQAQDAISRKYISPLEGRTADDSTAKKRHNAEGFSRQSASLRRRSYDLIAALVVLKVMGVDD